MIAYHASELEGIARRAHPWSTAQFDASHKYIDFKSSPHLIREVIEDLSPYSEFAFAKEFFRAIEWINGPNCVFESNDCAFRGPSPNIDKQFPAKVRCSGRLMILFRDIVENTDSESIDWLMSNLMSTVSARESKFKLGAVGISRCATVFMALHPEPKKGALVKQIMISLFAYGNSASASLSNMEKVVWVTHQCLVEVDGLWRMKRPAFDK